MKKLKCRTGETLVEMLCSMLIISFGVLMLTGAVVSSARLNDSAKKMANQSENSDTPSEISEVDGVLIFKDGDTGQTVNIKIVHDRGNYRYEKK